MGLMQFLYLAYTNHVWKITHLSFYTRTKRDDFTTYKQTH